MVDGAAGLAFYMLFTFIPALLIFGAIVNFLGAAAAHEILLEMVVVGLVVFTSSERPRPPAVDRGHPFTVLVFRIASAVYAADIANIGDYNAETAGGRHFSEAADGTRTHDLLHGKQTLIARSRPLCPCKWTTSAPRR